MTVSTALPLPPAANYIAGTWVEAGDGEFATVVDKYSGESLSRIPHASAAQMERAIAAALDSRAALRAMSAGERSAALHRLADAIEARADAIARLIVAEAGKPIGYARTEVSRSMATVRAAADEALRFGGEVVPLDVGAGRGRVAWTMRVPVGVVAAITPFNFPLNLVLHKVAPAMAVGCPVVLKPATQAPLSAFVLAELLQEIGWPGDAVQVLQCGIPVAEQLVRDERVAMLSFTGSDKVGWHLKAICGKKRVALELGGNAAVVVDEGVDVTAAAKSIAMGANLYAGQTCISTQRIFVHDRVAAPFRERLVAEFGALGAGDPNDPDVSVGPLIDAHHFGRIGDWVDEAVKGGATVLTGGAPVDASRHVYAATLLTDTTPSMKVNREEVFGPVAVLESVRDFETALARVNDSRYGLQAGVYTDRASHVRRAHEVLEVGAIVVNGVPGFRIDSMPYGGVKDSGLGREGPRYAMAEMTEPRLLIQ